MDKFAIANLFRNIILNIPKFNKLYLRFEGFIFNIYRKRNFRVNVVGVLKRNFLIFNNLKKRIHTIKPDYTFKDKIVLEIGPGSNLILAILLILNGAKQVILVDRYKQIYENNFSRLLNEYFITFYKSKIDEKALDYKEIMQKIKYYSNSEIENIYPLEKNYIDLVFSLSVLEHVENLEKSIAMVNLLLKPKAFFYSSVDLRDHFHIRDQCYLDFLKYSKNFWKLIGHTNRERFNKYINLFEKYHMKICKIEKKQIGPKSTIGKIKGTFIREYSSLSTIELSIGEFKILAQKN
jgi:SAM-dependent methyltransferase